MQTRSKPQPERPDAGEQDCEWRKEAPSQEQEKSKTPEGEPRFKIVRHDLSSLLRPQPVTCTAPSVGGSN